MQQQLADLDVRGQPGYTRVYWDIREELLICLADLQYKAWEEYKQQYWEDPLAAYCEDNPWEDECRMYDV